MGVPGIARSAIARAHGNDLQAIQRELEDSLVDELVAKYLVTADVVRNWEVRYRMRTKRRCKKCHGIFHAAEMATTIVGAVSNRCVACGSSPEWDKMRETLRIRKRKNHVPQRIDEEIARVDPIVRHSPRIKMSDLQGGWNRWTEMLT
jgi:hypothetical protein